ncbi:pilus assembly protein TadG-related protein [Sphingomonas jaspsi]|uniref:pilus assembly protein TadG-related protein n=1 Tax=Sphingomonas jaspsi TaxID=392409 RepID=UPI0004B0BD08|nr:pilus assembly protein TadG-related protein [Sphingomonas jaspsi]
MRNLFKDLWNDRRGNVLIIIGAALPVLIGAAGLATDTIQWTLWKRQLQRAADSAAMAGAYDRAKANGATTGIATSVSHDLTLNLHTAMALQTGYPQVTFPANSGSMKNQVKVTLAVQQRLPFSSMFVPNPPVIIANATAANIELGGDACVEALENSATKSGIQISGNAGIYMPDCTFHSNSKASNAAYAKGSSAVTVDAVSAVGGIAQSNNWTVNAYRPYSPAMADPFANINPVASNMKCAQVSTTKNGKTTTTYPALDETTDLNNSKDAGGNKANCFSSLSVGANKTLTLPAGTYYINGGDAFIQGNLTCNDCTIVLTNTSTATNATIGQFKVNASSNINITAPTSGTYQGIAIFQDRRAVDSTQTNKINGNSASVITGALYFPSQELQYNGTGNTTATCTQIVARRVDFSGNSTVSNRFKRMTDCTAYGLKSSGGTITIVRLVA